MCLVDNLFSQSILEISPVWVPLIAEEELQCPSSVIMCEIVFLYWYCTENSSLW
jgi:hypothetical protein